MSAREDILARVRQALGAQAEGVQATGAQRRAVVAQRLAAPHRHLVPARTTGKSADELVKLLRGFMEAQTTRVEELNDKAEIPGAIARYLREHNLPARLRAGSDPLLHGLAWTREAGLGVRHGRAEPADETGLTRAEAGIAETGTLLVASGPDNPVTLNFLPETHIVVVARGDIVGPYEDAWEMLRKRYGPGSMPRTVNMISAPSRTADIGGKIVMGAHGPRRLLVLIVGPSTAD